MAYKNRTIVMLGFCLCLPLLSACSVLAPKSTPTLDLNPIRTEVAVTVFAQVSQTAAAIPTDTPVPSPLPTFAPSSTSTPTISGVTATVSLTTTAVTTTPGVGARNLAQWVSQTITDETVFEPGEAFTITWRLKNVGDSTWTAAYIFRFYSGEAFGAPKELLLGKIVLPGETVDISIPMKAPVRPGDYRTDWVLANENRSNFKEPVFLKIKVAAPPTTTPTPLSTRTPSP